MQVLNVDSDVHLDTSEMSAFDRESIADIRQCVGIIYPYKNIHAVNIKEECIIKNYRGVTPSKLDIACSEVKRLLRKKYIVRTTGVECKWLIPVVMVLTKKGEPLLTLDFKKLNKQRIKYEYKIPSPQEVILNLPNIKYFSKFSIKDGFFNIPLAKASQKKTTFMVNGSYYMFKRLPIGYGNSHVLFQKAMDFILKEYLQVCCISYFTDIFVYSETLSGHRKCVVDVLFALKEYGIEIIWETAEFAMQTIDFHTVHASSEQAYMEPDNESISKVLNYGRPVSKLDLLHFLSYAHINRKFIKNIAEILKPLYILSHSRIFYWNPQHTAAFQSIKKALSNATSIMFPNFNDKFTVETSVNTHSICTILKQNGAIIEYASTTLKINHREYTFPEKAMHAITSALARWHEYLMLEQFTLVTDYPYMDEYASARAYTRDDSLIAHWYSILDNYSFDYIYRGRK
ncbi:hypothetical protein NEAUS07_1510 [Nematocida ausubeli]|nr:hypothetical protein NEAUS07_1510 [Nematocida ausubeli]